MQECPLNHRQCRWAVNWTQFKVWAHDFRCRKSNYNIQWRIASSDDIWCSFPKVPWRTGTWISHTSLVSNKTYLMFRNVNKKMYKNYTSTIKYTQHCSSSARFVSIPPQTSLPKKHPKVNSPRCHNQRRVLQAFLPQESSYLDQTESTLLQDILYHQIFVSRVWNLQDLCNFFQWLLGG